MRILVVVDMQNDFISGSLGTREAQTIVPKVINKIREYQTRDSFIIYTVDTHGADYLDTLEGKKLPIKHCIGGTDGWYLDDRIARELKKQPRRCRIEKSSFCNVAIVKLLSGLCTSKYGRIEMSKVDSIEFVGLCTDICVISNVVVLRGGFYNTPIIVDASCCAGTTPAAHQKALELMHDSLQVDVINWRN